MRRIILCTVLFLMFALDLFGAGRDICDITHAERLFGEGKYKKAAEYYLKCARFEELKDKPEYELIRKWYKEASYCFFEAKNMSNALNLMEESIAWAKRNGNDKEVAESLYNKGTILLKMNRLIDSLSDFKKSAALFKKHGKAEEIVKSLNMTAHVSIIIERFSESEKNLKNSMELCKSAKLADEKLETAKLYGDLKRALGQFKSAEKYYNETAENYLKKEDNEKAAGIYDILAETFLKRGMFQKAYTLFKKSEELYEKSGMKEEASGEEIKSAFFYVNKGEFEKAEEIFSPFLKTKSKREGRKTSKKRDNKTAVKPSLVFYASIGMGNLEKMKGNYNKSLKYYLQAVETGVAESSLDAKTDLKIKTGDVFGLSGDYDNAILIYQSALFDLDVFKGKKRRTEILEKMAELAFSYKLYDSAINYYEDAMNINRSDPLKKSVFLSKLGEIYFYKNDKYLADKILKDCVGLFEKEIKGKYSYTNKLGNVWERSNGLLFILNFKREFDKSLVYLKNSEGVKIEGNELTGLKTPFILFKTVKSSPDIHGNVSYIHFIVIRNGEKIKGYRIKNPSNEMKLIRMMETTVKSVKKKQAVRKDTDLLKYLSDAYRKLSGMKDSKIKRKLMLFINRKLYNILVAPYKNILYGAKNLTLIPSTILEGLKFEKFTDGKKMFGEMFDISYKNRTDFFSYQ